MKARKSSVKVFLTGGLGNQLFQLAAALSVSRQNDVTLYDVMARPRLNSDGRPELESLILPDRVHIKRIGNFNPFISKVIGFNLRSGFNPRKLEETAKVLLNAASSLVISIYFKKLTQVIKSNSLGYDPSISKISKYSLLIGYFQTFRYIEQIGVENFVKFPKSQNFKFDEYVKLSKIDNPLIVHIRLGDYKNESDLGVLSAKYYSLAIRATWDESKFNKIWLFSDEPTLALEKIPTEFKSKVVVIDPEGLSTIETLEVMTHGSGFVLANSSFSWWGATLRKKVEAPVCAPVPWFRNIAEPLDIRPENWSNFSGFDYSE
jgi:hypothetical protein